MAEQNLEEVQRELQEFQLQLPNILDNSVPEGKDEHANVEIRCWAPPEFCLSIHDHVALGESFRGY